MSRVDIFGCCFCFPDDPVDDESDPRKGFANRWQVSMKDAPFDETKMCLFGGLCCPCAAYSLRKRALGGNLDNYQCCQGYFSCGCIKGGSMGESSMPEVCLCLEAWCCLACATSATRFYIMDKYSIVSDPCDNRIIRFNNFMQCLSIILNLLSICIEELRDAATIVDIIAKIVFYCTVGCMTAQMNAELAFRESNPTGGGQSNAPYVQGMERGQTESAGAPPVATAVPVEAKAVVVQ